MSSNYLTSYVALLGISNNLRKLANTIEKSIIFLDASLEQEKLNDTILAEDYE